MNSINNKPIPMPWTDGIPVMDGVPKKGNVGKRSTGLMARLKAVKNSYSRLNKLQKLDINRALLWGGGSSVLILVTTKLMGVYAYPYDIKPIIILIGSLVGGLGGFNSGFYLSRPLSKQHSDNKQREADDVRTCCASIAGAVLGSIIGQLDALLSAQLLEHNNELQTSFHPMEDDQCSCIQFRMDNLPTFYE